MSTPHDIYGLETPPSGHPNPQAGYQQQQSYTPPQYPHPSYYQQAPATGCGTYVFRFIMGMFLLFVGGFFLLFLLACGVGALTASMQQLASQETVLAERLVRGNEEAGQKIAVITVEGMILESEDGFISRQIRSALKDEKVKAVVLRIDSPGGTITGSDYYHHLLTKLKRERNIPIIVSMGSVAASGGYYLAVAGDEIFAERTSITGSIGVVVSLFNGAELCKKIGIESTPIVSGPHKTMGSFSRPMTDEEKELWQKLVDNNFARFKEVIRDGRPEFAANPKKLDALATGRVFMADEAEENGLIDRIGFLDDAIDAAQARVGLTDNNSKTIRYRSKRKPMDVLLEGRAPEQLLKAETIVDATTPRVYLLMPQVLPIRNEP